MTLDPRQLGRVSGMLEVLALISTEAAGTLAFEFTVHPLLGASLETAYGAYVSTGPCSRGKPWETRPLEWWTSSWAALRWTLSEWSRGETPSLPIARPRTSLGSLEEATELRGLLGVCADDAAETTCDALAELVGPDAEVGVFLAEYDDGRMWRVELGVHTLHTDCILRGPRGTVVLTLGCDD